MGRGLTEIIEKEAKLLKRERCSTAVVEELRGRGMSAATTACIGSSRLGAMNALEFRSCLCEMSFAPEEAYQFDWSHETITLQNLPLTIKAAHMKLSHSRMPFVRVYFGVPGTGVRRHDKAFQFYGGVCRRGSRQHEDGGEEIYVGKARRYNGRFLQMCSHHLIEPVACTPLGMGEVGETRSAMCATICKAKPR